MITILLDIDGVLLPSRSSDPWGHFAISDWQGEKRMIDEQMRSRVVRLFRAGDVVWCTAWNDRSAEFARSLHLPQRDFLPISVAENAWSQGMHMGELSWKLHAVAEWDEDTSPLIWIDDNIESDAERWARERRAPTLLLSIEEEIGLLDSHIDLVEEFAAGL